MMIKCSKCNQHYDEEYNRYCPYCTGEITGGNLFNDNKETKRWNINNDEAPFTEDINNLISNSDNSYESKKVTTDNNKTIFYGASSKDNKNTVSLEKLLAGWLVIIEGEGKGKDFRIGYGQNSIGRGDTNMISIDFGDKTISREQHAFIIYDPKHKEFIFKNGNGQNLSYLNEQGVYSPVPIKDGDIIEMGKTKLKFIQFCGKNFDWE